MKQQKIIVEIINIKYIIKYEKLKDNTTQFEGKSKIPAPPSLCSARHLHLCINIE
jgi:hypothetical protein